MDVKVRKLDPQGRLLIPGDWRREALGGSNEVVIMKFKDHIKVTPLIRRSLTEFLTWSRWTLNPRFSWTTIG